MTLAPTTIIPVGPRQVVLQIDDGGFERYFSVARGTDGYYVNRITPASYPATLKAVQLYFGIDGPQAGTHLSVVTAANPSGAAELGPLGIRATDKWLPGTARFVDYPVPEMTITSGDFLVGFAMNYEGEFGVVPVDTTEPRDRSYVSLNGVNFVRAGQSAGSPNGNFAIRAIVSVSGQ